MKNTWKLFLLLGLISSVAACSHKATQEDASAGEEAAQDAGTDAVPQDGTEQVAPPQADAGLESLPTEADGSPSKDAKNSSDNVPPSNDVAAAPAAPTGETSQYTVHAGDTLMKIAFENYGDLYQWKKIYDMNKDHITDPNRLEKGTVLTLDKPETGASLDHNGERYLIKIGDTLARISDDVYGTEHKWKRIWENNRQLIKDPNRIYAGFFLYYLMTDDDQKEKQEFLKQKGAAPLAEASAPADASAAQPAAPAPEAAAPKGGDQAANSGLIDPAALSIGDAPTDARTPSSVKGAGKKK
jgi:LysM repeat protein